MRIMSDADQHPWDHILARGLESLPIAEMFKSLSIIEMKHAYMRAESASAH